MQMRFSFVILMALAVSACSSDRFNNGWSPVAQPAPAPVPTIQAPKPTLYQENPNADLELPAVKPPRGISQSEIITTPLVTSPSTNLNPALPPVTAIPNMPAINQPSINQPVTNLPGSSLPPPPKTQVASLPKPAAIPVAPMPPRGNVGTLGTWNVNDTDGKCRVTLTGQSFFEYNRASSTCKGASLSKVNAWEKRGNDVVLLEPGGKVAARLSPQGNGSYAGSTAKGADVNMSR